MPMNKLYCRLVLDVETDREKELCQQLEQGYDTSERLQDELRQAEVKERQLQMQLDKMKDDVSQLRTQKKDFDDFEQRGVPLSEQEMKIRNSKLPVYSVIIIFLINCRALMFASCHDYLL